MIIRARILIVLMLILTVMPNDSVYAEKASLLISHLEVQIMPEYDKPKDWPKDTPNLLTGLYGEMVNAGSEPYSGEIRVKVPSTPFTQVTMVVERLNGRQAEHPVAFHYDTEHKEIVWTPSKPLESSTPYYFAIEYYNNPFLHPENARQFVFEYVPSYFVEDVQFYFFYPYNAVGFTLSQPYQGIYKNDHGQWIYYINKKNMSIEDRLNVSVQYFKNGYETFYELKKKETEQKQTASSFPTYNWIAIVIVAFGMFAIGHRLYHKRNQRT